jgi:predicted deacetylase
MYLCCFRLDDITPGMNKKRFDEFREIFDKNNIKPLIGVVPNNKDETLNICPEYDGFWDLIKELKNNGWGVAQHGYTHDYCTKNSGILRANNFSEFAGLPFSEQSEKIRKGKAILEEKGIFTDIFMAPGHTFDKNTLRALESNEFKYITDGYSKYPYFYRNLKLIPCMHVVPTKTKGIITVCIHLNHIQEEVYSSILKYIEKNRENIINFDEAINISEKNIYGLVYQRLYIVKRLIKDFLKKVIGKLINFKR